MSVFSMAGSNPALPTYPLQRSVRLRSSASAYFNRTPAAAGDRRTWTWSGWVKRGLLSSSASYALFSQGVDGNTYAMLRFLNDAIVWQDASGGTVSNGLTTTAIFRDPSSWYHIVFAVDTTQATAANRNKLYVNGVQITAFSTASYPSLNFDTLVNSTNVARIGSHSNLSLYFDGYLEEINFIDGQALTPSSFGAYNSYGVWSPAKYTGTYGTNGFYLSFQDNSSVTTTANVGIGADSSGNGNYWTSNNISLTAGATYDSMVDVPTLTSNTNANYATLNPLPNISSPAPTYTNGNLSGSVTGSASTYSQIIGTQSVSSGKWYVEITATSANRLVIGFSQPNGLSTTVGGGSSGVNYVAYRSDTGNKYINAALSAYGATFTTNDIIGIALDLDNLQCTFYKNNVSQGLITGLTAGEYTLNARSGDSTAVAATFNANFGQRPFTYTPPTGFNRLNTYNLPESIVPVGAQYMAATTYTGNGSTQSITNTVNGKSLQPDMVWVKDRSAARANWLVDSVRGVFNILSSNATSAESTISTTLTSFNSNGFSVGSNPDFNTNAETYVGWQWRASNASAVTNTAGTITSQVSANRTAGFSIVTYTGTGVNGATVGHGLGVAPSMVFYKTRSNSNDGCVFHASLGGTQRLILFSTASGNLAAATDSTFFNNTAPSSTVLTLGTRSHVNDSSGTWTYVAYCFAAVPGYSAFGSYTGTGNTDGPFVYLGFRPRFILIKSTSAVGNWEMLDSSRDPYNPTGLLLRSNSSAAELNGSPISDFLSNGFKPRSANGNQNDTGVTYIYMAFAENPFKNALAR